MAETLEQRAVEVMAEAMANRDDIAWLYARTDLQAGYRGMAEVAWTALQKLQAADALAATSWQPIETAPKDGREILAAWATECDVVFWVDGEQVYAWQTHDGLGYHRERFTHWMPVPPLPTNRETLSASAEGAETGGVLEIRGNST